MNITSIQRSFGELLLYYSFDTENGTVVQNDGSLENGTAVGGMTYVDSRDETFGRAFVGNRAGANDAYVQTGLTGIDLGMGASSASGGVYTAMAWVNWNGTTSLGGGQGDHMIFGAEDGPGNNAMLHLGIRDEADGSHAHYGGWGNDLNNGGIVTPGEWPHLTFQYDGTDKVIYVNGEETLRGAGGPLGSEALPVIVGGHGRDAPDPAGMSFNGAIDEVKVFDEALTAEMIQAAMIPSGGSVPRGLEITNISVDQNTETVSLTFNSRPGRTYSLFWTPDLAGGPDYTEVDDSISADAVENQTTYTFPVPRPEDDPGGSPVPKAFFVIRKN